MNSYKENSYKNRISYLNLEINAIDIKVDELKTKRRRLSRSRSYARRMLWKLQGGK